MKREKCSVEGCNNVRLIHSRKNNKTYYHEECSTHHKGKYGMLEKAKERTKKWFANHPDYFFKIGHDDLDLDISKCSICNWDKTNCDIHRIKGGKEGGKYEKSNVIVVCPNCHRLIHRNIILL